MSIIGMPSFAMLLVLMNITLCLSVEREKYTSDLRRPAAVTLSPTPQDGSLNIEPSGGPDGAALTAIVPLRTD